MMRTTLTWPVVRVMVFLLTAMTCGAGITPAQPPAGDAGAPPVRRALLIGINKYIHVPRLNGSLNDVETMRQVLTSHLGFLPQHVTTVTDEAATRAGILAALERLVRETGPRDIVYLHYSGHGSQVQDFNGDEQDDRLDETLIPQDGRGGTVPDITDDELDEIVSRLQARSALIVLDSCHSGTATRGVELQTRSVPPDTRLDLYRKAAPQTRGIVPLMTDRYVLMTGAASHQSALDGPVDGRYHGFFTYALSRSLGASRPGASPRDIFAGIERELKRVQSQLGRTSMPEPQLEARPEKLDQPLLPAPGQMAQPASGPSQAARLPWLEVKPGTGKTVSLVNGVTLGALPGSVWAIYPPGDTAFLPGRALAVAIVTKAQGSDAVADLSPPGRAAPPSARAVALAPAPPSGAVPVRLRDVPSERKEIVEKALRQRVGDVEIVGPGQFARFVLDVQKDTLRVFGADGLQEVATFPMSGHKWAEGLSTVVSRSATASELLTLDNPSTQLMLEARIVTQGTLAAKREVPIAGTRGVAVVGDTKATHYRIRKPGARRTPGNSLQIEVRASADGYLTVVDVDSQGGVNLLFPNALQSQAFAPDGYMRGGQRLLIPDSLKSGNRSGFHWDYAPPAGTDTIRVFFSTDLDTARAIRQRVEASRSTPGASGQTLVATRAAVKENFGSLRLALAQKATRGIITVLDQPEGTSPEASGSGAPAPGQPIPELPTPHAPPAFATGQGGSDWTATSLTVLVES